MKIKDLHPDIERYLEEDCYCRNEIYGLDGFGCQNFYAEQECDIIENKKGQNEKYSQKTCSCIAHPFDDNQARPQILVFKLSQDKKKVLDAYEVDATENNIRIVKTVLEGGYNLAVQRNMRWDHYSKGAANLGLKKLMSIVDGIMID